MTLKCQLLVFAVFIPWAGRDEWPHRNRPLMPLGWRSETTSYHLPTVVSARTGELDALNLAGVATRVWLPLRNSSVSSRRERVHLEANPGACTTTTLEPASTVNLDRREST